MGALVSACIVGSSLTEEQELAASVTQLQESYKHLKALFTQSEQALSQVGARIEGVKDKAGKAPVIGGGQN